MAHLKSIKNPEKINFDHHYNKIKFFTNLYHIKKKFNFKEILFNTNALHSHFEKSQKKKISHHQSLNDNDGKYML